MKKIALFVTGAVVGYFGCVALMLMNVGLYDETVYEDDEMKIKAVSAIDKDGCFAMVKYKQNK